MLEGCWHKLSSVVPTQKSTSIALWVLHRLLHGWAYSNRIFSSFQTRLCQWKCVQYLSFSKLHNIGDRWDRENALILWILIRLRRILVHWNRIFRGFKTGIWTFRISQFKRTSDDIYHFGPLFWPLSGQYLPNHWSKLFVLFCIQTTCIAAFHIKNNYRIYAFPPGDTCCSLWVTFL